MRLFLERVLEPEVMDTPEEARDYDAMDHVEVNARFCEDFLAFAPASRLARAATPAHGAAASLGPGGPSVPHARAHARARALDVGTGTALIPIELCRRVAELDVVGIDLAKHMLALGSENVARAGLAPRITLQQVDAKATSYADGAFTATISNSIVHHIPEPRLVLAEMWRVTAPGGVIFVRDLVRPDDEREVDRLVGLYAGTPPSEPEARRGFESARELLRASLRAALTLPEITALVTPLGIPASAVRVTSDRHWTLAHEKP